MVLTQELWQSLMDSFVELSWKVYSIVPLKIQNTDTESGVTVFQEKKECLLTVLFGKKNL